MESGSDANLSGLYLPSPVNPPYISSFLVELLVQQVKEENKQANMKNDMSLGYSINM